MAWSAAAPVLVLVGGALLLLAAGALSRRPPISGAYALFTVTTAGFAAVAAVPLWQRVQDADRGPFSTLAHSVGVDGFSVFVTFTICAAVILSSLLLDGWLRREGMEGTEPYVLVLLSASGGVMMASANDLIVMFLGLEILSLAVYVLAAMHLRKVTSQEAGVKYFVLGAFSSAFFLYGIALTYGATGSTNLVEISAFLSTTVLANSGLLLAGMALLLVGFGFKVAAVPFHFWTPDVYQAAPTPSVAWMASGVKVAGFAGLLRVFYLAFGTYSVDWQPIIYALAALTLIVGSVLAIVQTDVKRMLAYSSINHAGFVLVAVQAATAQGVEAALFYLAAYTFMVAGSFGIIAVVSRKGDIGNSLDDYRGLSRDRPVLALAFALLLFAQAGVPLTSGLLRQVLRDHRRGGSGVHRPGGHRDAHGRRRRVPVPADHRVDVHVGRGRRRAPRHPGAVRRGPGVGDRGRVHPVRRASSPGCSPARRKTRPRCSSSNPSRPSSPTPPPSPRSGRRRILLQGFAVGERCRDVIVTAAPPNARERATRRSRPLASCAFRPLRGAAPGASWPRCTTFSMAPPSTALPDVELVELARSGDRTAFDELLRRHDVRMRGLAYRLMADRHRMDDALQEAYLKAFKALPRFRAGSDFGTWLYRITYNACIDELRKRKRSPSPRRIRSTPNPAARGRSGSSVPRRPSGTPWPPCPTTSA